MHEVAADVRMAAGLVCGWEPVKAAGHVVVGFFPAAAADQRRAVALVEPLIPPQPPAVHGRTGRPRVSDRDVLEGIAFVLSTGIGWAKLPTELGYGSGWTCWRRMHEWADAGVLDRVHQAVLARLWAVSRILDRSSS